MKIRLRLRSYDHRPLDVAVARIIEALQRIELPAEVQIAVEVVR